MKGFFKILLIFMTVSFAIASLGVIVGAVYLSGYSDSKVGEELLKSDYRDGETQFYCFDFTDRTGRVGEARLLEEVSLDGGIKYKYVPIGEMPEDLINAFISIEDKRFMAHEGIDIIRSGKAVVNYIFGQGRFGGSTITQQLVKNLTGDDEFSIRRKIEEGFSAVDLEKRYDKTEILEMYLNVINLSNRCRGVGAAAELFYSKNVGDLSLSECAVIAAITNNPSRYDPIKHPENNKIRRDIILRSMFDNGYIAEEEYSLAVSDPISLNVSDQQNEKFNSWYIDMVTEDVIADMSEKYGISKEYASLLLYRGGYKIYIAQDKEIQSVIDGYYSDEYNFPVDKNGDMPRSSMIVIDRVTGDILAVAGDVGVKKGNRIQNFATDTKRPPGSTIKPLSIYARAIDEGLVDWSTLVEDSPVSETDGRGWPANANGRYEGEVTVKYAVENSLNTVPVKLLEKLGADSTVDFLRDKLNVKSIDPSEDRGSAALALGQNSKGVTLRELTAAYTVFCDGIVSKPRSYFKVTDSDGIVILDNTPEEEAVISRESAAICTKLLQTVVDTGTANGKITLDDKIEVAGKTGTTQKNCDRYFIGYTPEILAGVWYGYDYPKPLDSIGGNMSIYIWDDVMSKIYESKSELKKDTFDLPDTVQKMTYEAGVDSEGKVIFEDGWFVSATNHN